MNFIEHPSYSEQVDRIQSILSNITMENINQMLDKLHLKCISMEHLETSGRINLIFNLIVQSKDNSSSPFELILKICNPHTYWKDSRTKNEVYTMQYLLEHTTIPIPKILDYSIDMQTNVLSCQYILMEKLPGKTLETTIEQISPELLRITILQLIDYIRQMREVVLHENNRIGSFITKDMSLGGTIEDGPTLGPFDHIKDFLIQHLQWAKRRIQTDEILFENGKDLIEEFQTIIDYARKDSKLINCSMKYYLTHTDLNSSNILIDENTGHILAILDWERCAMTSSSDDLNFYQRWFDNDEKLEQFHSILLQQEEYHHLIKHKSNEESIKFYLDIVYPSMYATFYSSTWFKSEQTVIEHIQRFLHETRLAISKFNNNYIHNDK